MKSIDGIDIVRASVQTTSDEEASEGIIADKLYRELNKKCTQALGMALSAIDAYTEENAIKCMKDTGCTKEEAGKRLNNARILYCEIYNQQVNNLKNHSEYLKKKKNDGQISADYFAE